MEKMRYISMLVCNTSGVLTRISGLFARRGYNIESLSVCATEEDDVSRMTIAVRADEKQIIQMQSQLRKQVDVICITEILIDEAVVRELLMVKLEVPPIKRSEVLEICTIFKAKTIDLAQETMIVELTGVPTKIDAFIEVIRPYEIVELARSGASALHRGTAQLKNICNC